MRVNRSMPRFHLNLTNSIGYVPDQEGAEADTLDAARGIALATIRSLLSDEIRTGRLDLRGRIDIADPQGTPLTTVAFREAVDLRLDGSPS